MSSGNNFTGFIPTASSTIDPFSVFFAFNPVMYADSTYVHLGWVAGTAGAGSWLQIECPTAVRIWKVSLCINNSTISSWKISGAGDELVFTDLLTSNVSFTQNIKPQDFLIDSISAYKIYRLTALAFTADSTQSLAVNHFQIFTYFKDGD